MKRFFKHHVTLAAIAALAYGLTYVSELSSIGWYVLPICGAAAVFFSLLAIFSFIDEWPKG
jgi:hypothetical protein